MKRKYSYKTYGMVQKTNSFLRDKLSPDPTKALKVFGIIGTVIGFIIKHIIALPIHIIAFAITGLFYRRGRDTPYKGSFIYTFVFIGVMGILALIISMAVKSIQT